MWGNISTGCRDFTFNPSWSNNSISLAIVVGLHDMYRSLKLFDCFNLAIRLITFEWSHSLGGSTMTSHISVRGKSFKRSFHVDLSGRRIFSAADAMN